MAMFSKTNSFCSGYCVSMICVLLVSGASGDIVSHYTSSAGATWWGASLGTRGQSFVADASVADLGSIGFFYDDANAQVGSLAPAAPVFTLFNGVGYAGSVVAAAQADPIVPKTGDRWIDADFTGVTLIPGQTYSFQIFQDNFSSTAGAFSYSGVDGHNAYLPGDMLRWDGVPESPYDLHFRVLGASAPAVPAPLAAIMAPVMFAYVAYRRRNIQRA